MIKELNVSPVETPILQEVSLNETFFQPISDTGRLLFTPVDGTCGIKPGNYLVVTQDKSLAEKCLELWGLVGHVQSRDLHYLLELSEKDMIEMIGSDYLHCKGVAIISYVRKFGLDDLVEVTYLAVIPNKWY